MNWLNGQSLTWEEPLTFTSRFQGQQIALLYSGLREAFSGADSYLFLDPIEIQEGSDWSELPTFGNASDGRVDLPDWVGFLGYELAAPKANVQSPIKLPVFRLIRYRRLLRFSHHTQTITAYTRDGSPLEIPELPAPLAAQPSCKMLASNFTRARYDSTVRDTIAHIHAGDFYQANITRKFFGELTSPADGFTLFQSLCAASPAPYSAYIKHGAAEILSASPECFLTVGRTGVITTRPIKGSARRSADGAEDIAIRQNLETSAKNHAENLMIVDLMRNDLSRVSLPESVHVLEQSHLYSYATIHHLVSTIRAQKRDDATTTDVIRACFPPGSMTGAPKIAAMDWCAAQETMARGVYSGAIGWFGAHGSCDLSVVIRTLILEGNRFEFQVGGGIVADSTPEDEWLETLTKARGILKALGIDESVLAAL